MFVEDCMTVLRCIAGKFKAYKRGKNNFRVLHS